MFDYGRRTPELVMLDDPKAHNGNLYVADHKPFAVQVIQLVEAQPPPRTERRRRRRRGLFIVLLLRPPPEEVDEPSAAAPCPSDAPDTYSIRMKRILAWREDFSSQMSATLYDPSLSSPLKRKMNIDDDDLASQSSKRSRSLHSDSSSSRSLGEHSCPACDASFDSRQSFRQHGRDSQANEACCVAVDYAFE
ncbi:hypothetical protein EYR38_009060 [Pleurotus pulmonarius]|nr:hypothetical protein EYR38_009060 [Pleurotus pulmonarius]